MVTCGYFRIVAVSSIKDLGLTNLQQQAIDFDGYLLLHQQWLAFDSNMLQIRTYNLQYFQEFSYSVYSVYFDKKLIPLHVTIVPYGRFSAYLWSFNPGARKLSCPGPQLRTIRPLHYIQLHSKFKANLVFLFLFYMKENLTFYHRLPRLPT